MISQNRGGLPIFLADLGIAVKDGIERYGLDGFAPGDVVIMNHGEVCGQHLNNVVDLRAVLSRRQGRGVRGEPRPLGRYRRHRGSASARSRPPRSTRKACSSARSRSTRRASATRRCGRSSTTMCAFPKRRSAICARRSPAASSASAAIGELLRALRARTRSRTASHAIWDATEREARAFVAKDSGRHLRGRKLPRQ